MHLYLYLLHGTFRMSFSPTKIFEPTTGQLGAYVYVLGNRHLCIKIVTCVQRKKWQAHGQMEYGETASTVNQWTLLWLHAAVAIAAAGGSSLQTCVQPFCQNGIHTSISSYNDDDDNDRSEAWCAHIRHATQ